MDRAQGVRVPAPIFNRRRPRQALFAHPNNSDDSVPATAPVTGGLGNTKGIAQPSGTGGFKSSYQGNQQPKSTSSNQYYTSRPPILPSSRPIGSHLQPGNLSAGHKVTSGTVQLPGSSYTTHAIPGQHSTRPGQPLRSPGQQTHTYSGCPPAPSTANNTPRYGGTAGNINSRTSASTQNNMTFSTGGERGTFKGGQVSNNKCNATQTTFSNGPTNYGGNQSSFQSHSDDFRGTLQNKPQPGQSNMNPGHSSYGQERSRIGQIHLGPGQQFHERNQPSYDTQPRYGDCPARPGSIGRQPETTSQYGQQPWGAPELPSSVEKTNPWTQTPTQMNETSALPITTAGGNKRQKKDTSLYFITATVPGMKHWSQYAQKISMLFEVFGTLNSAVSANNDCNQFNIKDDKDAVGCIFYQIDRKLPRLVRSQWLRCVGMYNETTRTLQCVSVRLAEESEIKLFKNFVNVCDKNMKKMVAKLPDA